MITRAISNLRNPGDWLRKPAQRARRVRTQRSDVQSRGNEAAATGAQSDVLAGAPYLKAARGTDDAARFVPRGRSLRWHIGRKPRAQPHPLEQSAGLHPRVCIVATLGNAPPSYWRISARRC